MCQIKAKSHSHSSSFFVYVSVFFPKGNENSFEWKPVKNKRERTTTAKNFVIFSAGQWIVLPWKWSWFLFPVCYFLWLTIRRDLNEETLVGPDFAYCDQQQKLQLSLRTYVWDFTMTNGWLFYFRNIKFGRFLEEETVGIGNFTLSMTN